MASNGSISITESVKKWLNSSGYQLEMDASTCLHELGYKVNLSKYYVDPNTSKVREIDIIAEKFRVFNVKERGSQKSVVLSIKYFIECKYSQTPWVILSSKSTLNKNAYFTRILGNRYECHQWQSFTSLQGRMLASIIHILGGDWISRTPFEIRDSIGYRMKQMRKNNRDGGYEQEKQGRDSSYEAANQISNCMRWFDTQSENNQIENIQSENNQCFIDDELKPQLYCEIGIPLIILHGPLIECLWNGAKEEVSEVDSGLLFFSPDFAVDDNVAESSLSMIRIITKTNMHSYFRQLCRATEEMLSCDEALLRVYDFERSKMSAQVEEIDF